MKTFSYLALTIVLAAGGVVCAAATAVAQQPTPFQAMPPILVAPPTAPAKTVEKEIIEGDPERKSQKWQMDRVNRLEDFDRLDLARPGTESVERPETATGLVRPDVIVRPEPIERPATIERPERVERAEKAERLERVIERLEKFVRPEKVERRERVERPDRSGHGSGRVERIERSGRRRGD